MRRLMLLRHAKSDWPHGVSDHERPLAPRGEDAAPRMAAYMAAEHLVPDLALVSPARRTAETWALTAPAFDEKIAARREARLYEARTDTLMGLVRETPAAVATLLLVGHNPGLEVLAKRLAGHGDRYAFARLKQKFPTAALAVIDFAAEDWREVAEGGGRLDRFMTPKMLGGEDD